MECRNCEAPCGKDYEESTNGLFFCCMDCAKYFLKQEAIFEIQAEINCQQQKIIEFNLRYGELNKSLLLYITFVKKCKIIIFMLNSVLKKDKKSFDGFSLKYQEIAGEQMEEVYRISTSGYYLEFVKQIKEEKEGIDSYLEALSVL